MSLDFWGAQTSRHSVLGNFELQQQVSQKLREPEHFNWHQLDSPLVQSLVKRPVKETVRRVFKYIVVRVVSCFERNAQFAREYDRALRDIMIGP